MARASSGLPYPERFYAAASYVGLHGSDSSSKEISSRFSNDSALLLYGLYQQATVGSCETPKPSAWNPIEQSKWKSWQGLGNMPSIEAMRLFVKILEEEDPSWYSRISNTVAEPVFDVKNNYLSKAEPANDNGGVSPEANPIGVGNGNLAEAQEKKIVPESYDADIPYNKWNAPTISGQSPRPRYEHGAAVIQDKMYIYGGNHNGRYLNDLHVLDLRSWVWTRVEMKVEAESEELSSAILTPCAGHSLVAWEGQLLSIGGHTKNSSDTIQVKAFDLTTHIWSNLKTYGKPPVSRGGQSVTVVGKSLLIFGGQDGKRSLLNDLHILDLETMTWDEIETLGIPPSPRSDHAAAVHADRYLLIFGGGSHSNCYNDLHVLDMQTMEWTRPTQQGEIPSPRAGHAGVTIGENWFIVGGGDNRSGASETVILNMSTFVWSVVTSVKGRVPLASEGLSLAVSSCKGEVVLVAFGGYNGRYNNEVNLLKPSHELMTGAPMQGSIPDVHNTTNKSQIENRRLPDNNGTIAVLGEKDELEKLLDDENLQSVQLKQELAEAESRNADLYKELQSVRTQLAAEQSRCFKLEVDVAELRQKLQTMESLQKELDLLQRQKVASENAALNSKRQNSGGIWGWLAGSPPEKVENP